MAIALDSEEFIPDDRDDDGSRVTSDQVLAVLHAIGKIIGARAAVLIGVASAAVLGGLIITAASPAPNAVWAYGIFCSLVGFLVFRNPRQAS